MEAFESFVAVALEADNFVVSSAIKFDVKLKTKKAAYEEFQSHGYEVDLIGARADRLVLATVKSFLGSRGVVAEHVTGQTTNERWKKLYALLNNDEIRRQVIEGARDRYGYPFDQIELRLYAGRSAAPTKGTHETAIREWAEKQIVGAGPIKVFGLQQVIGAGRAAAERKQYRDDPVLVTLKVLQAAGHLNAAQG